MFWIRIFVLLNGLMAVTIYGFAQEATLSKTKDLLRQASKLVPEIPETQQMSVASNIANAQARAGDLQGALATVYLLKKPQDQAQALGSVAYSIDYSGNLNGALTLLESASKGQSRDVGYIQIANAHARDRDFAGALAVAHRIQDDRPRLIEALDNIASERWKAGDHSGAQQNWEEARQVAKQRSADEPSVEFFLSGNAGSHAQAGDTAGALQILREMRVMAEQRHPPDEGLLSTLAMGFIQAGDVPEALEIVKRLPSGSNRDIDLMLLSNEMTEKDDIADAEGFASQIADPQLKAHTFQEIANAQAESGRPASAIDTLDNVVDLTQRAEALASLAMEQAQRGDGAAEDTLGRAVAAAREAAPKPPDYVFANIAVTEAILGDFETAKQTVRTLQPDSRWWALENMTQMLAGSGDLGGALQLAADETNAYPKACALLGAANAMLAQLHANKNPSTAANNR